MKSVAYCEAFSYGLFFVLIHILSHVQILSSRSYSI